MAAGLGRIVGVVAFVLVLLRLDRVLATGPDTPNWAVVGVAAGLLGALVTWSAQTYRLSNLAHVAVQLLGMGLIVLRVAAPQTLALGIIPGGETLPTLGRELGYALDLLRFGAPPVLAVTGLVALLAVGAWVLGGLWAWGATTGRVWFGIAPSLAFYLYLAVMDRGATTTPWMVAFSLVTAAGLLATSVVARAGTGRVRDQSNRPVARRRAGASALVVAVVVVGALGSATALGGQVPPTGTIHWRNISGFGSGLGEGVSFNLFASLQQDLVSRSDQEVFRAAISQAPAGADLYWKLITLDTYTGTFWLPGELPFRDPASADGWGEGDLDHRGPTHTVQQSIRIGDLRQEYLPALRTPVGVTSESDLISSGLRVRQDGSLRISGRSFEGLAYQVTSSVPVTDMGALASVNGALSPIFAAAADQGSFDAQPRAEESAGPRPSGVEHYTSLPDTVDRSLRQLAQQVTASAITPVEQAILLESFFRDDDRFVYSTDVSTGHSALDLTAWLTAPESTNYRTGYCEQFAAAMAVLGRTIGLPTRVVMGFTPGERESQADGSQVLVVRQRNAHAWVEVWFDEAGWVRFDPTPRGDGLARGTTADIGFDPLVVAAGVTPPPLEDPRLGAPGFVDAPRDFPQDDLVGLPVDGPAPRGTPAWVYLATVAAMATAGIPLFKWFRRRRRLERSRAGDVTAVWDELIDRLDDLGQTPHPHLTPVEFAAATDRSLMALAHTYSQAIYGHREPADAAAYLAAAERWIRLRFPPHQRAMALLNPRSLLRRAPLRIPRSGPRRARRPRPA